jgi:hypothetical protein
VHLAYVFSLFLAQVPQCLPSGWMLQRRSHTFAQRENCYE